MKIGINRPSIFSIYACLAFILLFWAAILVNRAFMIASLTGIAFLLIAFKKVLLRKRVVFFAGLFLVLAIAVLAIYVKGDSSLGRLLIYKITWRMFVDHPLTGIGWGNFQREYGLYQASFFQSGQFSHKEFLLAGNTYYAFNDYWQFVVETGIIGASCLLLSLIFIVNLIIKSAINCTSDQLAKLFALIIIVVGVAALFTHVFEERIIRIITVVSISYMVLQHMPQRLLNFRPMALTTITILLIVSQYYYQIFNYANYKELEQAKTLSATGYVRESQKIFAKLYPSLKSDLSFLKDYNDVLTGRDNANKKIGLLKQLMRKHTDNISYLKLANVYEELGMSREAENAYLLAVNIVPNRFVPKEALFNFYIKHKQYKKAKYFSKAILSMPIKIPSKRIEGIKQTIKNNHQILTLNTKNKL